MMDRINTVVVTDIMFITVRVIQNVKTKCCVNLVMTIIKDVTNKMICILVLRN